MTPIEAIDYLLTRIPDLRNVRPMFLHDAAGVADSAEVLLKKLREELAKEPKP